MSTKYAMQMTASLYHAYMDGVDGLGQLGGARLVNADGVAPQMGDGVGCGDGAGGDDLSEACLVGRDVSALPLLMRDFFPFPGV